MRNNEYLSRREFLRIMGFGLLAGSLSACHLVESSDVSKVIASPQGELGIIKKSGNNEIQSESSVTLTPKSKDIALPSYTHITDQKKIDFLTAHEITEGDSNRKVVMMTYDDNAKFSQVEAILKAFRKYPNTKATFFFEGQKINLSSKAVKAIVADGHTLGCHGWDHLALYSKLTDSQIDKSIERCFEAIDFIIPGFRFQFIRFPYGDSVGSPRILRIAARWGMQHVYWTMGSNGISKDTFNIVTKNVKPGSIVLSHMFRYYDYTDAEIIVDSLINQGNSLESVSTGRKQEDIYSG
jgi:peptidoglycan/xylan/chitin deacetylase (PgdA/CDA1 family)